MRSGFEILLLAMGIVGLLFPLLHLSGAIVCLIYRRLSSWLLLAFFGFLGEALAVIAREVLPLLLEWWIEWDYVRNGQWFILLTAMLQSILLGIIVVGLWMAFADIQRRWVRMPRMYDEAPSLPGEDAESRPWKSRKAGSPDIQQ